MLGFDAQLLGLDVDLNVVDLAHAALLLSLLQDPAAQLVVDGVSTALALLVVVLAVQNELLLELARELLLAGLDGLLAHVDSPVVVLDDNRLVLEHLGLGLNLARQGVVVAIDSLVVAGRGLVRTVIAAGAFIALAVLLGLAGRTALGLVLLGLLGHVLEHETAELQAQIDLGALATGLAVEGDAAVLDVDIGLGVLALLAENELGDEAVKELLELAGLVGAVDDPAVIRGVEVGLGPELEAEVLDQVGARAGQRLGDAAQVDNNGLDAVALAFDLGLETLHLVAIEGVADIAADVDEGSHDCGVGGAELVSWLG